MVSLPGVTNDFGRTGTLLGDGYVDSDHAFISSLWSFRGVSKISLGRATDIRRSTIKKKTKAEKHLQSVVRRNTPLIDALRAEFNQARQRQEPWIIPDEAHQLIQHLDDARERRQNCTLKVAKAEVKFVKAQETFRWEDARYQSAAINLAKLPAEWKMTATAEVVESTGEVNVYFCFDDNGCPQGHYVVFANGAVNRLLEPSTHGT